MDYVGNKGSFLPDTNNINFPTAGAGTIQTRRPYPRFGNISYNTQDASSTYHSLQAKVERRLSVGLLVPDVLYVFEEPHASGELQRRRQLRLGKGAHRLRRSAQFRPQLRLRTPFGKGKRLLTPGGVARHDHRRVATAGNHRFRSGIPYTPTVSPRRREHGRGQPAAQPHRLRESSTIPRSTSTSTRAPSSSPPNFTYGNSGGSILRRDYLGTFDFSSSQAVLASPKDRGCSSGRRCSTCPIRRYFSAPESRPTWPPAAESRQHAEQPAPDAVRTEVQLLMSRDPSKREENP